MKGHGVAGLVHQRVRHQEVRQVASVTLAGYLHSNVTSIYSYVYGCVPVCWLIITG